jgi:hypothetical protein
MPTYDLQYGAYKTGAGQLQISGSSAAAASIQRRPNGNAAWQAVSGAVWSAGGTAGTPDAPVAGCTLNLASAGSVNGQNFDGTATYTTSLSPAGYYTSATASPTAGLAEWDAADGSGTV